MTHKGGSVKNAHKMAETLRLKIAPIESPIYVCTRSFLFCHDTLRDFCCYFKGHEAYNLQSLGWTTNMSDITHGPWENMVLSLNSFVNHPICPQKCRFFSFARWFMMTSFSFHILWPPPMQQSSNDAISWLLLDNGAQHPPTASTLETHPCHAVSQEKEGLSWPTNLCM